MTEANTPSKTTNSNFFSIFSTIGEKIKETIPIATPTKDTSTKEEIPGPWRLPEFVSHMEPIIKKQILLLSEEKYSFLESPPAELLKGFEFNLNSSINEAQACLKADPKLVKMRFLLVPSKVIEEKFWRNYFARVYIIKKAILDAAEEIETKEERPIDSDNQSEIPSTATNSTETPAKLKDYGNEEELSIDDFEEELRKELNSFDDKLNLDYGFETEK